MQIPKVWTKSRLQIADLRDHQRKQRVARDIERNAQEEIRCCVGKAGNSVRRPGRKTETSCGTAAAPSPRFPPTFQALTIKRRLSGFVLICVRTVSIWFIVAVGGPPIAPLRAVNATEVSIRVRPFIPDRNAVLAQIADIGVAAQKPEQFVDDRSQVQLLRRENGNGFAQIETCLRSEDRERPHTRPITARLAVFPDQTEQIVILAHDEILSRQNKFRQVGTQKTKLSEKYKEGRSPDRPAGGLADRPLLEQCRVDAISDLKELGNEPNCLTSRFPVRGHISFILS